MSGTTQGDLKRGDFLRLRGERPLPDYTWPQRMPLDQLRRLVARELNEAAEMAAQVLPDWREHA